MDATEYLAQRVEAQTSWHDRQARRARRLHTAFSAAALIGGGLVTLLTRYPALVDVTAAVSVAVTVLGGLAALGQYRERWVEYRSVSERLQAERLAYLTRSGPYAGGADLAVLVGRVEGILGEGLESWRARAGKDKEQ